MKKIILIIYFLSIANLFGFEAKLEKIVEGMNKPWSLSFIDQKSIIITEKKGKLFDLDLKIKPYLKLNTIYLFLRTAKEVFLMYSTMIKMYIYHTLKKEMVGKLAPPLQ